MLNPELTETELAQHDAAELISEIVRLRSVVAAAYNFASEMAGYCSPHGVATDYADRLEKRLDRASGVSRPYSGSEADQ